MKNAFPDLPDPILRLVFDGNALAANWRALDAMAPGAGTGAAVKADAYGTGAERAVRVLRDAGCEQFYVAHWAEVPDILPLVPGDQISVLHGPLDGNQAEFAMAHSLRPVINSLEQADIWLDAGGGACDLMVDTGMNRLGLRPEQLDDSRIARLTVDTMMSHLACADEDSAMNARQRDAFQASLGRVPHRRASLANSAGIALGSGYHFDLTRPGLSLYGGIARPELADIISPVVMTEAALVQVRDVPTGETVGYGGTFTAPRDMRVGIVSLGYADGYLRCWSDIGRFVSEQVRLPVIGRVSMDMAAIDLTAAPHLHTGDWVRADLDLPDAAQRSGLSQYELLTLAGRRLRR